MALLGSAISGEVGLRLLLCPLGSNIVIRTACCTVGVALPVYSTFKAIEKKDQDEQQKWLVYWAAYGSFSLVEMFSDKILYWFPLYYPMKFAFLLWLQLPSGNGSRHLYLTHLRPFLLRHQARLDRLLDVTFKEIEKFVSSHREEIQLVQALLAKGTSAVSQIVKDLSAPAQSHARNAIEDRNAPTRPQIEELESNHDDSQIEELDSNHDD